MSLIYGDLHIHVGRTSQGKPVKITASPALTLENILRTAQNQKGLQLIGIVDAACTGVLADIKDLAAKGQIKAIAGGGYQWQEITLFLGSEVEIAHSTGKEAHFLAFFPDLQSISSYAKDLGPWLTNPTLSTQRLRLSGDTWLDIVVEHKGVALAAHAFTPHKGVYGNCVRTLQEMFRSPELIQGLELGLSADTKMALQVKDAHDYAFLSNSDAHSLGNIAREFTLYDLPAVTFNEWRNALQARGAGVVSNHGLEPLLGKYYRSFCPRCELLAQNDLATLICPACGGTMVYGVWDRLREIRDFSGEIQGRPPYQAHVPLALLPGVGPKTYKRLIENVGTEIDILYNLSLETIQDFAGPALARQIKAVREGSLLILPGGGGKYGQVTKT